MDLLKLQNVGCKDKQRLPLKCDQTSCGFGSIVVNSEVKDEALLNAANKRLEELQALTASID